jgi:superoxide dismutase, Fe-Mn family
MATTTYTLPELPYAYNALEPFMDEETLRIHHTKHHQTYVTRLNEAIANAPELKDTTLEALLSKPENIPNSVRTAVINNGGGHFNHSVFWTVLGPNSAKEPSGEIRKAIVDEFGHFSNFKEKLTDAAVKHFGSGWGWLCLDAKKKLVITSTHDQETPLSHQMQPLLVIDVWEHAYYLKYRNMRASFVEAIWNIVNWDEVNRRYRESA